MSAFLEWLLVAVLVAVLATVYLTWTASRVDRMHSRVAAARAVLDAQLLRRSGAALELATSGLLDPASSLVVADAAHHARAVDEDGREQAESDLTETLGLALGDPEHALRLRDRPGAGPLLDELAAACRRVEHARRFHNDAVRTTRRLRRKVVVRRLGLAGRAGWPETVEMDDSPPPGLR
jgi:hypothetical protein